MPSVIEGVNREVSEDQGIVGRDVGRADAGATGAGGLQFGTVIAATRCYSGFVFANCGGNTSSNSRPGGDNGHPGYRTNSSAKGHFSSGCCACIRTRYGRSRGPG